MAPNTVHKSPRQLQMTPRIPQGRPRWTQSTPRHASGRPQGAPKAAQGRSKEASGRPQGGPKAPQGRSKAVPSVQTDIFASPKPRVPYFTVSQRPPGGAPGDRHRLEHCKFTHTSASRNWYAVIYSIPVPAGRCAGWRVGSGTVPEGGKEPRVRPDKVTTGTLR